MQSDLKLILRQAARSEFCLTAAVRLVPANAKALARYFYARVPGAAPFRFALKDRASRYVSKPEFGGVAQLPLGPGPVVDVGANRGQSIAAFRRLVPGREIIAFEPDPRCADRLQAHFRSDKHVIIRDCALGRSDSRLSFFAPRYGMWDCDGMAATSLQEATLWLRDGGRMFRFDERLLSVQEYSVDCRKLDSFSFSPALVKLHAQGAELGILEGAVETLRRSQPVLLCAYAASSPLVVEFLSALNYRPYKFDDGRFARGMAPSGATFTWFFTDRIDPCALP